MHRAKRHIREYSTLRKYQRGEAAVKRHERPIIAPNNPGR